MEKKELIRGDYSKYIHEARRAVPTPHNIARPDGMCEFGTFDREFEAMDFLKLKGPTALPNAFNRLKLTLWEATEVHFDNGVLLAVVCDMGIFGKTLNVFYDKRTKSTYCWDTDLKSKDTKIAPNLIKGSEAFAKTDRSFVKYINNFDKGKAHLSGSHKGECLITRPRKDKTAVAAMKENMGTGTIEYDLELTRLSDPCVVSIPFDRKRPRPLYSQKDFFKAEGELTINGEKMVTNEKTTAIIDDHRGFYPRRAHYDWVTTLGRYNIDGEEMYLGFNLTRNQSINQDKYNENILWLEGKSSLLPPVTFTRDIPTSEFKDYQEIHIRDEYDMVNLTQMVYSINPMITHAGVVNIDYYISFGELKGYLRDETGKKYTLDGCVGMGEDKTLLL
ncbi:MAG: DUF2804 domain-containing protein [Lachnospiraceae bacterium]|nr:DUF2804 domain-containing protein [Lachnospiraceae bacterium]